MIGEPSIKDTIEILKGLRERYEQHHRLKITDEALDAAANLGDRYISDRFLPDKAIDLIDEAGSRVRLLNSKLPPEAKEVDKELRKIQKSKEEAVRDQNFTQAGELREKEVELRDKIRNLLQNIRQKPSSNENPDSNNVPQENNQASDQVINQSDDLKVSQPVVNEEDIAHIVASWTGVPVQKLTESESVKLLNMEDTLHQRLIGQDEAVKAVSKAIPELKDKLTGNAIRVPTPNVSLAVLVLNLENSVDRDELNEFLKKSTSELPIDQKRALNKLIGEVNNKVGPLKNNKTRYGGESNYTLQGGKDYRETIFTLPEDITTNASLRNKGGHFGDEIGDVNNIYHIRYDTRFTPDGKKVFMINEIQSDVNQSIAKSMTKAQQLACEKRLNPFNADLELNLLVSQRGKMLKDLDEALANNEFGRVNAISSSMKDINTKLQRLTTRRNTYSDDKKDYFPMVESDSYGDHAIKYLMQKAARENVDYVAVAPFDKVSFRQGYKAGNERFYGYANGKGIGKKGKAVIPDVMSKNARFYGSKAGPTKISLSDPTKPYKNVSSDRFKYPSDHPLKGKEIKSTYHSSTGMNPEKGTKNIPEGDPRLYFDAYAIKVVPLMRNTQKTYKSKGGLVVDMFKPIRYN